LLAIVSLVTGSWTAPVHAGTVPFTVPIHTGTVYLPVLLRDTCPIEISLHVQCSVVWNRAAGLPYPTLIALGDIEEHWHADPDWSSHGFTRPGADKATVTAS